MEKPDEHQLVTDAAKGDLASFEQLVGIHESGIRAFFRVRLFDWSAADDLAQDVFVTAFQRIATFRGESTFGAWIRGIAANHLRNYVRKRRDEPVGGGEEIQQVLTEHIDLDYHHDTAAHGESLLLAALEACLEKLDGPARDLLHQRYTDGCTVRQIAAKHTRGYSALTMQLLRIRASLAACIRRKIDNSP